MNFQALPKSSRTLATRSSSSSLLDIDCLCTTRRASLEYVSKITIFLSLSYAKKSPLQIANIFHRKTLQGSNKPVHPLNHKPKLFLITYLKPTSCHSVKTLVS
ncbi:uncharacterized protein DS421_18g623820 [Arachis hypogaea]|nr:uncharacterized protein DS421_18g623820 [Arachis hypogaea]